MTMRAEHIAPTGERVPTSPAKAHQAALDVAPAVCFQTGSIREELGLPEKLGCEIGAPLRHLSTNEAEALGRLVPAILCGEESAVHVFYQGLRTLPEKARPEVLRVVTDETDHEIILATLFDQCPEPADLKKLRATSRRFFMSMAARDPAVHFAHVSALDSGVCILMDELGRGKSALRRNQDLLKIVNRIKLDEAVHVGVTRRATRLLGMPRRHYRDKSAETKESFCTYLGHVSDSLENLAICPDRLTKRILKDL